MKKSWKTSTFGLMAAIGAGVVAATRTGILDGSHLPDWVNQAAGLCSVIGTAGLGFASRDNNVTSEQAGAAPASNPNTNPPAQWTRAPGQEN